MSKKAYIRPRVAPLQRVVAVPITDPAERAAIDKARKREKQKQRTRQAITNRNGAKAASRTDAKKRV